MEEVEKVAEVEEPIDLEADAREAQEIAEAVKAQQDAAADLLSSETQGKAEADKIRDSLTI